MHCHDVEDRISGRPSCVGCADEALRDKDRGAALIAVPWVTDASLIYLRRGDRAIVDFSDQAITSGQTDPSEILKWLNRGVRVRSAPFLHAKVFLFGTTLFVGSTNVSKNSAKHLSEALVRTNDRDAVSAARRHLEGLFQAGSPITKKLAELARSCYRRPIRTAPLGQQPDLDDRPFGRVWLMSFDSPLSAAENQYVESRRDQVAQAEGFEPTDLNVKMVSRGRGQPLRLQINDLMMEAVDIDDTHHLYAGQIIAVERRPSTRTEERWLLWFLDPPGFDGADAQPIEHDLAGLRIPTFEAWNGQRLGVERGKRLLGLVWPKAFGTLTGTARM